ncbi:hypothetical protein OPT61_g8143 [Boeremia exigua]|uniref:Uncharacterized protein n=1 Tax=Boeremia exigua TaxID=749465 RepID=A0ACC2HZZ8_9PLEO|nr:hypothetical protein OPT61_g8143 [Boeremia exigua]
MNFITLHYTYILVMTIIGSVIMYGSKNMSYIDALFFASGAATQSGLNTIDVNTLHLYQQVAVMLITCLCTPIFINTFVVFIRLYWFEKRFQDIVLEARSMRATRTRTLSKRKSQMKEEHDRNMGDEERGVGNRRINVQRSASGHAEGGVIEDEHAFQETNGNAGIAPRKRLSSTDDDDVDPLDNVKPPHINSNIMWADTVNTPPRRRESDAFDSPADRLPQPDKERSIAVVQNQRNRHPAEGTLRIPGPRDFDRGLLPERVTEGLTREVTRASHEDEDPQSPRRARSMSIGEANGGAPKFRTHITFDGPARPTTGASVYRKPDPDAPNPNMQIRNRSKSRTLASFFTKDKDAEEEDPMPYLSWAPTIGRNSNFVDLSEEQREELGGIEYRALKLLAIILVAYFVGFHLLGMVCLTPWITRDAHYTSVVEDVGVSPVWWGFFTPASMFNDLGFTLTPDSMISFQFAILPLLLGTFLIIIGNTGFPCMLRFVIWLTSKFTPKGSGVWEELRFLLDHPRRCFTLLFPSKANWWLFAVLLNDPTVTVLPPAFRFLDGLFQAAATRTAGFAVVNIAELHPAIQVSYLVMMYISIFPIAMSMRQTNVYEEKSLGVWADDDDDNHSSYLGHHLRRQLSFDLWFVFLGFFLISIVEGSRLENTNDFAFTLFSVLFEIVSAYGTVGLSLGYPGVNTSFSGQFKTLSKLIIIAMQIRGRHRGLPYALDRAILLPSESLHQKENEDATRRMHMRRNSAAVGAFEAPDGLTRQGTGLSRRSSMSSQRPTAADRFRPQQLKRILSGAFSAGPTAPRHKEH